MAGTLSRVPKRFEVYEQHGMIIFRERNEKEDLTFEFAICMSDIKTVTPTYLNEFGECIEITAQGPTGGLAIFKECRLSNCRDGIHTYYFVGEAKEAIYNFYFGEE